MQTFKTYFKASPDSWETYPVSTRHYVKNLLTDMFKPFDRVTNSTTFFTFYIGFPFCNALKVQVECDALYEWNRLDFFALTTKVYNACNNFPNHKHHAKCFNNTAMGKFLDSSNLM